MPGMTIIPLPPPVAATSELRLLRTAIVRNLAGVVRSVGVEEHELGCRLSGDLQDLHVVITGPPLLDGLRQALGVRVLDAVHADGRTFGTVDVDVRTRTDGD